MAFFLSNRAKQYNQLKNSIHGTIWGGKGGNIKNTIKISKFFISSNTVSGSSLAFQEANDMHLHSVLTGTTPIPKTWTRPAQAQALLLGVVPALPPSASGK